MKKIILISILFACSLLGYAQESYSNQFGRVSQHEMSMTEYDKDKDAEALVIYELGENYFLGEDDGFKLYKKRSIKIKILKSSGVRHADFEIPYYVDSKTEMIEDLEAYTYNLVDGQLEKTKLDNKNVFEAKPHGNWRMKKFSMPDVREGSVVELKYKIITPYFFNMGEWDFQKEIPVVYSQLKYKAIPYFEYAYILTGTDKFDEFTSDVNHTEIRYGSLLYKEAIYTFGLAHIPAFKDQEFISSVRNYQISLNFQLSKQYYSTGGSKDIISTWPDMCADFMKSDYFGKYIKSSEKAAKNILPTLSLTDKSQLEQTKEIVSYVKSMYNWNGVSDKYTPIKVSDFMKQKTGSSAEINLFMIGLLQAAKITVNPVVLSTRSHGSVRKSYPFTNFFNYAVAEVIIDDKKYYLDATESLRPFGELPTRCINVEGLVVKPKMEEWVILTQQKVTSTNKIYHLKINEEKGTIDGNISYASEGADAYQYRSIYLGKEMGANAGKDEYLLKYLQENNNIRPKGELVVSNFKDTEKPFIFSFDLELPLERVGNKLFINPFCNLSPTDNLFKQTSRTLPVDLVYIERNSYRSIIEIPNGYKVEELPRPIRHNGKVMTINYLASEQGNKLEIVADYANKSNVYDAKDYMSLKASYGEVVKAFSTMIVLVKE